MRGRALARSRNQGSTRWTCFFCSFLIAIFVTVSSQTRQLANAQHATQTEDPIESRCAYPPYEISIEGVDMISLETKRPRARNGKLARCQFRDLRPAVKNMPEARFREKRTNGDGEIFTRI
jgi:hypothetical protein